MGNWPLERILDLAIAIQQIPAPTFSERERSLFIQERFRDENLADVQVDELGNAYARLPGSGAARPLVVSAHTDTVFPPETDLSVTRSSERLAGPGIGDNALGVAGLFALLWAIRQRGLSLPGDLILVANVAEEGLGDSRGMRAVIERYGDQPLAYIALEGMALGHIFNQGLGVLRYRIVVHTQGGHSWVDHGNPSAIHELAALTNRLVALPLPEEPRTTLNVGVISGGTTVNTIASEGAVQIDLRSESTQALQALATRVKKAARTFQRPGVRVIIDLIGTRPSGGIPADHPLVMLAKRGLLDQGMQPHLSIGSTDINLPLSRGLPAICIGLTTGGGAHTPAEYILTEPLSTGLEQVLSVVTGAYQAL